ncbi:MAG: protein kinase [Bryobacterales bacterium]|nr:protein kinase [Bryobacterales bacterium]
MTPERWQQVEAIFHEALAVPESERAALLHRICPPELRADVDGMLAADRMPDAGWDEAVGAAAEAFSTGNVPKRVGAYEVLRNLGKGGMGTVFLGRRADGEYEQTVAIKFLRSDFATPMARERFRQERQILANLKHPHIAALYDGGTTPDGIPYLVLEYVDGHQVHHWCEERQSSPAEICRLLLKICDAVSYAHGNLIVHRDLKPSNILVAADGQPKLLDFGIAKLLTREAAHATQTGQGMLTPEYASPEQVRGQQITTATDVYALGATLYALLAGEAPFKFTSTSPAELLKVICEDPLPPPSASRPVPKDLDRIVLKAMQRDPGLRYRSVEALAEDLQRFLDGLPVRARGQSLVYRATKLARHYWLPLTAAVVFVASLTGAAVISVRQAQQAEQARQAEQRERQRAIRESERAVAAALEAERQRVAASTNAAEAQRQAADANRRSSQVRDLAQRFLFDFHDSVANLPGSLPARRLVVKTALEYLDSLAKDKPADPALKRQLASAYERIGDAQGNPFLPNIGDMQGAAASYEQALALRETMPRDTPELISEYILSVVRLADVRNVRGDRKQAEEDLNRALRLAGQQPPAHPLLLETSARVLMKRGDVYARSGRMKEALPDFEEAARRFDQLRARDPENLAMRYELFLAHRSVGRVYNFIDREPDALRVMTECRQEAKALAAADPNNTKYLTAVASVEFALTDIYIELKRLDLALDQAKAAIEASEVVARRSPDDLKAQMDYATTWARVANIYTRQAKHENAIEQQQRAVDIMTKVVQRQPEQPVARFSLAAEQMQLGEVLAYTPRKAETIPLLEQALGTMEDLHRRDPSNSGVYQYLTQGNRILGVHLHRAKRTVEALAAAKKGMAYTEEMLRREPNNSFAKRELARAQDHLKELTEALEKLRR